MKAKFLGAIVALGLCSLGSPVQATTIELPLNGNTIINGPFASYPENTISVDLNFQLTGGDYIGQTPPDPIYGPFYGYFITINVDEDAFLGTCFDNQAGSYCGRELRPDSPTTYVSGSKNRPGSIYTDTFIFTVGDITPVNVLLYDDLPDGFYVVPIPQTLSLFATGLVVLTLLGWRKKRNAVR